jgi:hypothetical protein
VVVLKTKCVTPILVVISNNDYYNGTAFPVWTNMVNGAYLAEANANARGGYYAYVAQ